MALSSTADSPAPTGNTPAQITPYRLPTEAVATWEPGPLDTAMHAAIRARIQPSRGWWQFEVRPWHVAVFFGSYLVVVGAFIAYAATTGAIR